MLVTNSFLSLQTAEANSDFNKTATEQDPPVPWHCTIFRASVTWWRACPDSKCIVTKRDKARMSLCQLQLRAKVKPRHELSFGDLSNALWCKMYWTEGDRNVLLDVSVSSNVVECTSTLLTCDHSFKADMKTVIPVETSWSTCWLAVVIMGSGMWNWYVTSCSECDIFRVPFCISKMWKKLRGVCATWWRR